MKVRHALICGLLWTACGEPGGGVGSGTGGTSATGGAPSSGGATSSGGTSATGGVMSSGGAPSSGGATASGGAPNSGGAPGSGGAMRSGGAMGSGGRTGGGGGTPTGGGPATGGASASGGRAGAGGSTPSTGCGKAPPASMRYSIDVGGTMREYILAVPTNYDMNKPYKLIFAWHPLGGSASGTAGTGNGGYYGLRGASGGAAILVSPEGLPFQGSSLGWANTGGRDITFLRAMLDRFKSEMCIDEARVFSTGFSFGGMMSYAVGCAGLARAIAPMAGNSTVSGCTSGTMPVAMMGFHGDHDSVVAISGGRTARDIFVQRNKCTTQTMPTTPSWCDGVNQSNQPCTCVTYQGCSAGYPTIWCEFNADHTPAPASATTIWNFFSQF